ncbi:MAG: XRE family transcriptional regulator [Firmicutes bacterium]|nr:XRE family transcriptional regulator [Bacillota bacterium]
MKIIAEKLRQARVLNNMSMQELANQIGVTKQTILQLEQGSTQPKMDTLFKIVSVLKYPLDFFTKDITYKAEVRNNFFRSFKSASALNKSTWEEKARLVYILYNAILMKYLSLPQVDLPQDDDFHKVVEQRDFDAIAMHLRNFWDIGVRPVRNMVGLLESKGFVISEVSGEGKIDAFTQSYKNSNQHCIILDSHYQLMARRNFNLAHELGHIVLHSGIDRAEVTLEKEMEMEKEANNFASAFLMPKQEFIKILSRVRNMRDFIPIKVDWCVSIKAMIVRANSLGIFDFHQYTRFMRNYSFNFNSKKGGEWLDSEIEVIRPGLFNQSLELLLERKKLTPDTLEQELSANGVAMSLRQVAELLSLKGDFFSKYNNGIAEIISIKPNN